VHLLPSQVAAGVAAILASCEVFDPATGKLSPTGSMAIGRLGNCAIMILDGRPTQPLN
jgi:hypothetical protein